MIDVIDPTLAMQNGAGSAVLDALVLSMTAGGATLDSALREAAAAARGSDAALGQGLKEALAGTSSRGALAALDLLIDRLDIAPNGAALGERRCGCGHGEIDSGVGDDDLVTMSLFYSDGGGTGEGEQPSDDVDGDGQPDEPIPVTGEKPKTIDEDDDLGSLPTTGGDGGDDSGGDGPGGGSIGNKPEFSSTVEETCAKGAALKIGDHIENVLVPSIGEYEFGAIIVKGADGRYGALGGIHTDYSPSSVNLTPDPSFTDYSSVHGIIQNQPWNDANLWANYLNRYPSGQDWIALERLANLGADPANLSIFITDPWGDTREFKLADRSIYEAMNDSERMAEQNLPPKTTDCG